jgi:hypothetical protein
VFHPNHRGFADQQIDFPPCFCPSGSGAVVQVPRTAPEPMVQDAARIRAKRLAPALASCDRMYDAATTGTNSGFGDFQWKSPFDTCPATMSPLSLTNLQVSVGGQNVLNSTLNMTYENFLEQVNLAEQLTSSDFGVSTGLISQGYWEASKWYFVNVERGNIADKLQPRNINVSFTNNSNVDIDVIIFTFYNDQLTIDVETGIVTK